MDVILLIDHTGLELKLTFETYPKWSRWDELLKNYEIPKLWQKSTNIEENTTSDSKTLYYGDNNLLLPQFTTDGNNSKRCSDHLVAAKNENSLLKKNQEKKNTSWKSAN